MSNLAIVALIVILIIVVAAGYVVYKHEHKTPADPSATPAVKVNTIVINGTFPWAPTASTYNLNSSGTYYTGVYTKDANTSYQTCMAIYKDSGYYYGLIDESIDDIESKLASNNPNNYSIWIVCFNPDNSNGVVPTSYLEALPLYPGIIPGKNVQNTAAQGAQSRGNSPTALAPTSATGGVITF